MVLSQPLPVDAVLPELCAALVAGPRAVLVAPPGAGKTTRVPLALLEQPWASAGKIVLLEPRRLAARAAAERMAQTLGEPVGQTIGLRARFDTRVSRHNRIEVITEGVFTRMILADPGLDGISAVIFDEFHERSLDADLGLALALEAQGALRDDLRILVTSATLDGARVATLLDGAPVILSEGRAFPVETRYLGRDPSRRLDEDVTAAILTAHRSEPGSILAFLPGQGEIVRAADALASRLPPDTDIAPLYGALGREAQDKAVRPSPDGRRKVVLATSIAETSLTIEGVRVVVDSGMTRVPRFEPNLGLTRLETIRVSRAAADQRRGRAGRTEPGICYRLWEEAGTGALQPFARPEILDADLSGLLINLAAWGARDPASLRWLDAPPIAALTAARTLLRDLDALTEDGRLTETGERLAALALPPRLARMVFWAAERDAARHGAAVAVLLGEHGLGGTSIDIAERLERWRGDRSPRAASARQLAGTLADTAGRLAKVSRGRAEPASPGLLLAAAFPDRIAKARGKPGEFLLANGRAAQVEPHEALAREPYLAVGALTGQAASSRMVAAAALTLEELEEVGGASLTVGEVWGFDMPRGQLTLRDTRRLGAIVLGERPLPVPATMEAAERLADGLGRLGIGRLPWTPALEFWRRRVMFLREAEGDDWPDLSDAHLAETVRDWLTPYLLGKSGLADLDPQELRTALEALLDYEQTRKLDQEAPASFLAPTGTRLPVDYGAEGGPSISVRVQELYGLARHPSLANGRVPLTLHLLSPAHRPIQVTRDLPAFWRGSWAEVRTEMKGRYPRHPWPENPAEAEATTRAKPRGT